jgi:predicted dehydrogenase
VRVDTHFPFYRQASTVHAYADGQVVVPVITDGDAYERQVEAFANAIRRDLQPEPDVVEGQSAVALIDATTTSVESGREVRL